MMEFRGGEGVIILRLKIIKLYNNKTKMFHVQNSNNFTLNSVKKKYYEMVKKRILRAKLTFSLKSTPKGISRFPWLSCYRE